MLPPPPPQRTIANGIVHALHHPAATPTFRATLFLTKLVTLFLPCAPFAANPWFLYSLLALAAVDVGILPFRWRQSWMLMAVHLVVVYLARQRGVLCEGKSLAWDGLD